MTPKEQLESVLHGLDEKIKKIHEDFKSGRSDKWLHARNAFDIIAQTQYELRRIKW